MATKTDKTAAAQPRRLMIRGDRLLLALDVLAGWVHPHPSVDLLFSQRKIDSVISQYIPKRFSDNPRVDEPDYRECFQKWYVATIEPVHRFLSANEDDIATTMFAASELITMLQERVAHHAAHAFERFICAIASGELTEADFKE